MFPKWCSGSVSKSYGTSDLTNMLEIYTWMVKFNYKTCVRGLSCKLKILSKSSVMFCFSITVLKYYISLITFPMIWPNKSQDISLKLRQPQAATGRENGSVSVGLINLTCLYTYTSRHYFMIIFVCLFHFC